MDGFMGCPWKEGWRETKEEDAATGSEEKDLSLLAPSRMELWLDSLADAVVAVSVFEQLHRRADADPKDHLEHRFVFEFKIYVEGLFKLVNVNGLDRFSSGTAERYLRIAMPERHGGA
jgi:hypothetical protein